MNALDRAILFFAIGSMTILLILINHSLDTLLKQQTEFTKTTMMTGP